jgi:hypothetical protein
MPLVGVDVSDSEVVPAKHSDNIFCRVPGEPLEAEIIGLLTLGGLNGELVLSWDQIKGTRGTACQHRGGRETALGDEKLIVHQNANGRG